MALRPATVTSTDPLMVQLHDGSASPAPAVRDSSYAPAVGDVVAVDDYDVSTGSQQLYVHGTPAS